MIDVTILPTVNATLNGLAAVLLSAGWLFIRRRRIAAHRACMVSAFTVSSLFLISYVAYHLQVGSVRYTGTGWTRTLYFCILITHVILAAAIVPLALVTITRAARGQYERHKRIARITLPIWLYVSVTGVIVYLMLYH